jgi:hypothetical protein
MSSEERELYLAMKESQREAEEEARIRAEQAAAQAKSDMLHTAEYGNKNSAMICPHCQTKGTVRAKPVVQVAGISGEKATGALITEGCQCL